MSDTNLAICGADRVRVIETIRGIGSDKRQQ
jgi:hypothetical protein